MFEYGVDYNQKSAKRVRSNATMSDAPSCSTSCDSSRLSSRSVSAARLTLSEKDLSWHDRPNPSACRSGSISGSDSAYGTLEDDEEEEIDSRWERPLQSSLQRNSKRRQTRSKSVDTKFLWDSDLATESTNLSGPSSMFYDEQQDSTTSFESYPTSSCRSSPEPSEFEFDLISMSPTKRKTRLGSEARLEKTSYSNLARRHTLPRRNQTRTRPNSISFPFVAPETRLIPKSSAEFRSEKVTQSSQQIESVHSLTPAVGLVSVSISLLSFFSPLAILPASPVHLLHPGQHRQIEYINALGSAFLIQPSLSAFTLFLSNLFCLNSLANSASNQSTKFSAALVGISWAAILILRVTLSWIFGRVVGWAHPEWFSTAAIHQVGTGLAPILLSLYILQTYTHRQKSQLSIVNFGLLAVNFSTPIQQGGTGFWWGLTAAAVGFGLVAIRFGKFAALQPQQNHLVTILVMTAPRPGNPDFLMRTVESWLGALPIPTSQLNSNSTSSRVRLIVYTHFTKHEIFDMTKQFFTKSPSHSLKANHYIEWHRDPRSSNRLDQRLHVARGLEYAATQGGTSGYVMLTEDDFPLCPDNSGHTNWARPSWTGAWKELQRVLIETNEKLPDFDPLPTMTSPLTSLQQEATAGHCGLFIATGGSGLAIRGFLAAKLPSILLGADDPHGTNRDFRAARGEFSVKHEDEGADTPDLVIQDCLRGTIAGCRVCAPPKNSSPRKFPAGSARNARGISGDRWGKSGLAGTERLMQHHLGYNASTLPGRRYGKEEWACGWRHPFNGEPDVLIV